MTPEKLVTYLKSLEAVRTQNNKPYVFDIIAIAIASNLEFIKII
jgi:hypothetical protein